MLITTNNPNIYYYSITNNEWYFTTNSVSDLIFNMANIAWQENNSVIVFVPKNFDKKIWDYWLIISCDKLPSDIKEYMLFL